MTLTSRWMVHEVYHFFFIKLNQNVAVSETQGWTERKSIQTTTSHFQHYTVRIFELRTIHIFLVTFAIHFCTEATCTEKLVSVQIDMEQSPQFKYVRICRACAMCMRKLFFIRKIVSVKKGIANSKKLYVNEILWKSSIQMDYG